MKKIILIITVIITSISIITAQCPNSWNLKLETQEDINNFVNDYPDCTEIENNLTIGFSSASASSSDITDLSGLEQITRIGRDLVMGHLDALVYFDGFSNVEYIGGDFAIRQNSNLKDLRNFSKLDSIGTILTIFSNDSLQTLSHLTNVTYIGDLVEIKDNNRLESIIGFNQVTFINRGIRLEGSPLLRSLEGLENIETVAGPLVIVETGIKDFLGLSSLKEISGEFARLELRDNNDLESLSGLEQLSYIEEALTIQDCPSLNSISSLSTLTHIGSYFRILNTALKRLNGMQNVTVGGDDVTITDNAELEDISDLVISSKVNDYVIIKSNDKLTNIEALIPIDTILGGLEIRYNASLSDCQSICNLLQNGYIEIGATISDNLLGCNSEMEIISQDCMTTNVENLENNQIGFEIMTNPVNYDLQILLDGDTAIDSEYFIVNSIGIIISKGNLEKENITFNINLDQVEPGYYFLIVKQEGKNRTKGFIKI